MKILAKTINLKSFKTQFINPLSSSPVRIPGFHPGDPGSNPGNGNDFILLFLVLGFSEGASVRLPTSLSSFTSLYIHSLFERIVGNDFLLIPSKNKAIQVASN